MTGVGRTYDSVRPVAALHDCNLRIDQGDYVAVMGPSGSGKSTLLNILGLIDEPTTGEYLLDGRPTTTFQVAATLENIRAYRIGFVFQSFQLVGYRSAVDNVETGLLYQRVDAANGVNDQLRCSNVSDSATRVAMPHEMSGGERQGEVRHCPSPRASAGIGVVR